MDDPRQAYDDLHDLTRSCVRLGRQARGLNSLRLDDAQLFLAVLRGEHLIKGFRNKDIVRVLYPSTPANSEHAERHHPVKKISENVVEVSMRNFILFRSTHMVRR